MTPRLASALFALAALTAGLAADARNETVQPAPAALVLPLGAPPAPADLQATVFPGHVELAWGEAPAAADVVGYRAEWSPDGVHFGEMETSPVAFAQDADLPANASLWYRVVAIDGAGRESEPSGALRVFTGARR